MDRYRDFWRRFDQLSDVKKVAAASGVALFLFSSWLYCLGFLGLAASSRQAHAEVTGTVTATATRIPSATVPIALPPSTPGAPEPTSSIYHPAPPPPTSRPVIEPPARPATTRTAAPGPSASVTPTKSATPPVGTTPFATWSMPTPVKTAVPLVTPGLPPTVPPGSTLPTATPHAAAPTATATRAPATPTPTPASR